METQNNDLLAAYQVWEQLTVERHNANPNLYNFTPVGSPDQENELQFEICEVDIDIEFFAIGYSEEENNLYFNHSKGLQVEYQNSTNPDDLNTWLNHIDSYTHTNF